MARKKKDDTDSIPFTPAPGVTPVKIESIEKAITRYERKKEIRCNATPDEVAAKNDLLEELHKNRDKLPKREDGTPFYRCDGVDYELEESLKRRKVDSGDDGVD